SADPAVPSVVRDCVRSARSSVRDSGGSLRAPVSSVPAAAAGVQGPDGADRRPVRAARGRAGAGRGIRGGRGGRSASAAAARIRSVLCVGNRPYRDSPSALSPDQALGHTFGLPPQSQIDNSLEDGLVTEADLLG